VIETTLIRVRLIPLYPSFIHFMLCFHVRFDNITVELSAYMHLAHSKHRHHRSIFICKPSVYQSINLKIHPSSVTLVNFIYCSKLNNHSSGLVPLNPLYISGLAGFTRVTFAAGTPVLAGAAGLCNCCTLF